MIFKLSRGCKKNPWFPDLMKRNRSLPAKWNKEMFSQIKKGCCFSAKQHSLLYLQHYFFNPQTLLWQIYCITLNFEILYLDFFNTLCYINFLIDPSIMLLIIRREKCWVFDSWIFNKVLTGYIIPVFYVKSPFISLYFIVMYRNLGISSEQPQLPQMRKSKDQVLPG